MFFEGVEDYLQLVIVCECGGVVVGYVCGLSRINGKNGKNGMRCVKWLILKGLVFSVFYSVFRSVFGFETESCLREAVYGSASLSPKTEKTECCRVRHRNKLVGASAGMRACFPFPPSLSLYPPYPVGCLTLQVGLKGKTRDSSKLGCLTLHFGSVR
jgi:hypothetical protein